MNADAHRTPSPARRTRARSYLLAAAACVLAFSLYAADVPDNPPGFYIDESSIAYNAHAIAQTGRDEHGEAWPLFFRAFGDYKNPTYVYLLAALFRLTGPSILAARLLSAALGAAAALLLGLLAARMTRSNEAGVVVACSALLTPWLYECSRLAFEVSAYPLVTVLFLLALWRASAKERWSLADAAALAAALALLTYTYSIGRLLGPLLAAGLAFFMRRNAARVVQTWGFYALALVPLFVFDRRNPGALTGRFKLLTYATPQTTLAADALAFARHYLADINPWRWLVNGESNIRDHLPGACVLLAATFLFAAFGLVLVRRDHSRAAWWRFILYALAVSVVPAALTAGDFPQLRLIALPIFLHVLAVPALAWLLDDGRSPAGVAPDHQAARQVRSYKRVVLYALVALLLLQGAYFQWLFHRRAPERWYVFDARFPSKVLAPALATNRRPIYLYDPPGRSGYIQAYWHGTLRGVDASRFVRLAPNDAPPPGALVISTEDDCLMCRPLARHINYIVYAVPPTDLKVSVAPLPPGATRASVTSSDLPQALKAGQRQTLNIIVRNVGDVTWPAVGEEGGRYAVVLRDRWLSADGSLVNSEDGMARMPYDLEPGDAAGLSLQVVAPEAPGVYVLELDVVQEGVAWFGARGSKTLRASVSVNASSR